MRVSERFTELFYPPGDLVDFKEVVFLTRFDSGQRWSVDILHRDTRTRLIADKVIHLDNVMVPKFLRF